MDATLGLFAREGCSGATTRQIALAAGVSEALVFKHFPTKESLYAEILRAKIREAERALPLDGALLALGDEPFFVTIAGSILKRIESDEAFLRLLLHSALEGHALFRQFERARCEKVVQITEERIRLIQARNGGRNRVDPALAARLFHGMILAALMNRHIFGDKVLGKTSIGAIARTVSRIFLNGLGPLREVS